jgi:hypothetical protein
MAEMEIRENIIEVRILISKKFSIRGIPAMNKKRHTKREP